MTKVLGCRLPVHEAELIEQYASLRGVQVSGLIREVLQREVRAALAAGAQARAAA